MWFVTLFIIILHRHLIVIDPDNELSLGNDRNYFAERWKNITRKNAQNIFFFYKFIHSIILNKIKTKFTKFW
jgi:hypothetical protein